MDDRTNLCRQVDIIMRSRLVARINTQCDSVGPTDGLTKSGVAWTVNAQHDRRTISTDKSSRFYVFTPTVKMPIVNTSTGMYAYEYLCWWYTFLVFWLPWETNNPVEGWHKGFSSHKMKSSFNLTIYWGAEKSAEPKLISNQLMHCWISLTTRTKEQSGHHW